VTKRKLKSLWKEEPTVPRLYLKSLTVRKC